MAIAASRIAIDFLDQLANRREAVAKYVSGLAQSGCHQLIAYDQQSIVVTSDVSFDNYARAFVDGDVVGGHDLFFRCQICSDAAAVVAVERLDYNWSAQVLGGTPGVFDI